MILLLILIGLAVGLGGWLGSVFGYSRGWADRAEFELKHRSEHQATDLHRRRGSW